MFFKKQYGNLERITSKSGIIILFLLAHSVLLIMMVFTFPRINAKMGTQAFDLKTFGYTPVEAAIMIRNLDQSTIDFYIFPQLFLLDILYPILLALFLSTLIIRLSSLIKLRLDKFVSNLFLLPFIAMFMDYLENIMIFIMLSNSTETSSFIIKSASIFTQLKALFTTISWIVIMILLVILLNKKWNTKKKFIKNN